MVCVTSAKITASIFGAGAVGAGVAVAGPPIKHAYRVSGLDRELQRIRDIKRAVANGDLESVTSSDLAEDKFRAFEYLATYLRFNDKVEYDEFVATAHQPSRRAVEEVESEEEGGGG